jgi:hypothetical protein
MTKKNTIVLIITLALILVSGFLIFVSIVTKSITDSAVIAFVGTLLFIVAGLCRKVKSGSVVNNPIAQPIVLNNVIEVKAADYNLKPKGHGRLRI